MRWALITFIVLSFSCSTVNAATWHEVARWEGKGLKNTETFRITSKQWQISWSYSGRRGGDTGVFSISASSEDGSWWSEVAAQDGRGTGDTIMRSGPGDFYLEIEANSGSWVVTVEDIR